MFIIINVFLGNAEEQYWNEEATRWYCTAVQQPSEMCSHHKACTESIGLSSTGTSAGSELLLNLLKAVIFFLNFPEALFLRAFAFFHFLNNG